MLDIRKPPDVYVEEEQVCGRRREREGRGRGARGSSERDSRQLDNAPVTCSSRQSHARASRNDGQQLRYLLRGPRAKHLSSPENLALNFTRESGVLLHSTRMKKIGAWYFESQHKNSLYTTNRTSTQPHNASASTSLGPPRPCSPFPVASSAGSAIAPSLGDPRRRSHNADATSARGWRTVKTMTVI